MMTNVTKRKYSKPSAKVVEWDFNESVCSSVVTYSSGRCLEVQRDSQQYSIENRSDKTGTWTRIGSR